MSIKDICKLWLPPRLSMAMLYYVVIAAVAAFLSFMAVTNALGFMAGLMTDQKNYYLSHIKTIAGEFQDYVNENQVSIEDEDAIGDWNYENWYVFLAVYKDNRIYYSTMDRDDEKLKYELKEEYPVLKNRYANVRSDSLTYPVQFADGKGEVVIRAYFEAKFQTLILVMGAGLSALIFVLVFLLLLQRKLLYIRQIEKGIHILEEGSKRYEIPLKGRDELYSLAVSINQMSSSLHQEITKKERLEKERNEMVTALSHDIRTPLTSVLFYLDLITAGRCEEKEAVNYMEKAKRQAYHMKNLMDDLFLYSYAMGDHFTLKMEEYDGNELFGQLIGDMTEALEERGFNAKVSYGIDAPFNIVTDVAQLMRVFNNIRTNVRKYSCKSGMVSVSITLAKGFVIMNVENPIREEEIEVESYGIGVRASEQLIARMGGRFTYGSRDYRYYTCMRLPVVKEF